MAGIAVPTSVPNVLTTALDIVRRLAFECGVSKDPVSEIPTILNTTEDIGRLVGWVITAWRDIQDLYPNWRFMRRSASFATVLNQATYTTAQCGIAANTYGRWDLDSFRNYPTAVGVNGEMFMGRLEYDEWRNVYQFGAYRNTPSRPYQVCITPDDQLGLGPIPVAGYTVIGDYYLAPVDFATDTDVPLLPAKHNPMIIVYKAMQSYGFFEGAPEVHDRGEVEYKKLLARLQRDQLPPIRMGGPLL